MRFKKALRDDSHSNTNSSYGISFVFELKNISLFNSNDDGCCGKKKMDKNCCKEKVIYFKIKDNHKSNQITKTLTPSFKFIIANVPKFKDNFQIDIINYSVQNYYSPPVLYDNPIYLKNRILLI